MPTFNPFLMNIAKIGLSCLFFGPLWMDLDKVGLDVTLGPLRMDLGLI